MSETTTWYKIKGYGVFEVVPIQVIKHTEKTIFIREEYDAWFGAKELAKNIPKTRDVRRSMNGDFFPTLEAANAAVISRYEAIIANHEEVARLYRKHLRQWNMVHPKY